MVSDESCFSDEGYIMKAHSYENIMECSSSPNDMSWCKCSYCISKVNIDEKIYCKNPLLLSNEEFENVNCIAQKTALANVCLDKNVLKPAKRVAT